jgi:hypothetical protein
MVILSAHAVPSRLKMLRDQTKGGKKALCLLCRFKPPHFLLPQSRGLMRIFRLIVQSFVLPMLHPRQDVAFGCSIAFQFISDDQAWHVVLSFEELAEKSFGGFRVAAALHKDVQHIPILIHRSPQVVPLTTDGEEDARPDAMYHHSEGDDGAIHWRRSAQISNTIVEPFHR